MNRKVKKHKIKENIYCQIFNILHPHKIKVTNQKYKCKYRNKYR